MSLTFSIVLTLLLLGAELLYLRVARQLGIVDVPNERSSHTDQSTIRGGGIVFWIAALGAFLNSDLARPYFFGGLTLLAFVSFLDDLRPLPARYRLGVQFGAVVLLLLETTGWNIAVFHAESWMLPGMVLIGVGILNAYNFMDGINGMTALYSLVTVGTIGYWHTRQPGNVPDPLVAFTTTALLIFGYFNVRRRAICFAGDVGSVSMAFIILYMLLEVVRQSQSWLPFLLLAVYGVDSVLTIGHRLYLRQPVFRPHRFHLFQVLVNRLRWPHLRVSALYALIQAGINAAVLVAMSRSLTTQLMLAGCVLGTLTGVYVVVKRRLMNG